MNNPISAYESLDPGGEESINSMLRGLIDRMEAAVTAGDFSAAYARMDQLDIASRATDLLDLARIRLRCSLAAYRMLDPVMAKQQLETTLELLGPGAARSSIYAHPYAVANWLLGLLNMAQPDSTITSVTVWQNSLQALEYLSTEPGLTAADQGWYADRRVEMLEAIEAALDGTLVALALQQVNLLPASTTQITVYELLSMAIYGIPGLPPGPTEQINLQPSQDEFIIGQRMYHLFSLREPTPMLALDPASQYCALRVSGDWMNWAGIEPGDYILLRFQEAAADGDIVAVEIFNVNSSEMIYQLRKDQNAILFRPQSTNAIHQSLEFRPAENSRYHIYGVVLGVFKDFAPVPQTPQPAPAAPEQETEIPPVPEEAPIPVEDFLQTFPIYADIPAGGPKVVPTFAELFVQLNRFIIDDWPYYIKNLRGDGKKINPGREQIIFLRVVGDSMNDPEKANIQDGEYVLLRRQNYAKEGDIVAAEIRGEDDLATLKRYQVRGNRVALVPESTNLEHEEREFARPRKGEPPEDQPFYIQGIALAVLTPYPKPNP